MKNMQIIDIERIKELMRKANMDNSELARLSSIRVSIINKLLSGQDQSKMRGGIVFDIAHVLDVAPQSLIRKEYCGNDPID